VGAAVESGHRCDVLALDTNPDWSVRDRYPVAEGRSVDTVAAAESRPTGASKSLTEHLGAQRGDGLGLEPVPIDG
jgi:hypothetical protein